MERERREKVERDGLGSERERERDRAKQAQGRGPQAGSEHSTLQRSEGGTSTNVPPPPPAFFFPSFFRKHVADVADPFSACGGTALRGPRAGLTCATAQRWRGQRGRPRARPMALLLLSRLLLKRQWNLVKNVRPSLVGKILRFWVLQ